MSISRSISLIDLSSQLNFEIDSSTKQELCFAEALIVSCCHVDQSASDQQSESLWSLQESNVSLTEQKEKSKTEGKDELLTSNKEGDADEKAQEGLDLDLLEDDFHFFFFDDLSKKPLPLDKDTSVIIINDLPQINPRKRTGVCLCRSDDELEPKCKCWSTVCTCGAKTTRTCQCGAANNICICHPDNEPSPICTCGEEAICLCHPDKLPRPKCTCGEKEPCLCHPGEQLSPFCFCGGPKPCLCHPLKGDTACNCGEGLNCDCKKGTPVTSCICGKTEVCFCRSDGVMQRVCTCGFPEACICDSKGGMSPICTCANPNACACRSDLILRPICTCDNPEACLCDSNVAPKRICTCANSKVCLCNDDKILEVCTCSNEPCLCHNDEIKEVCTCMDNPPSSEDEIIPICTCKIQKPKRRKKKRDGFVKCHDTDSHHTYFDFVYGIHDKFESKEKEPPKVNIIGLHDAPSESQPCPIHEKPKYQAKKVRTFSLDCCSTTGGLTISIETLGQDKDRFLVQVLSNFSREGAKIGTKLVSVVDSNLHTLEENRTEYITKSEITKERRNYMAICTNGYYNKITQISGEKKKTKRLHHTFEASHDLILEGANLVLLRYMAVKRFKGEIKTTTVLMGGKIASCAYISHGVSQALVNGKRMFVLKVDRQIIEASGYVHETNTVMSLKGRLISQEWSDSNYMLHINPLLQVDPETDDIQNTAPLRERWRDDMQLFSNFLEFKSSQKSEHERYLNESESLQGVIRDYLEALLMLRPTDALRFTRLYFGNALSALDLPHNEFFDPCSRHVRYHYYED